MAKGKHAAALFEVIHSSKRLDADTGALRTPKWWFKGRSPSSAAPAPRLAEPEARYVAPEIGPEPAPRSFRAPGAAEGRSASRSAPVGREFTLKLRLGTLAAGGFVLLLAMGIAYVVGRHVAGGPESASAENVATQQIRRGAPHPGALDVARRAPRPLTGSTGSPIANNTNTGHHTAMPKAVEPAISNANGSPYAPEQVEADRPRSFGLNYVVVQTYPPDHKQVAEQAVAYLRKYGISATVEPSPPIYHKGWFAVVGTRGFDHVSSDECRNYLDRIEKLGEKFGKSRFDHFQPQMYKWK